jgi:3-deoxy-D-manno-oct-2-ulosonic acid (Kdo) hydroxylase
VVEDMDVLEELAVTSWEKPISKNVQHKAIQSLEQGKVLYMPSLSFSIQHEESLFFSSKNVDPKRKNISYDIKSDHVGGALWSGEELHKLKEMLRRYALVSTSFLQRLFPHYSQYLVQAKTSFRPIEIYRRKSSIRKDDTRLHVDAFPSNPTKGRRILRMFTNVNPEGKPRVWRVGEPFEEVVKKFACKISAPLPGSARLLQLLKVTKDRRTSYDHYMLHMHNRMKKDNHYQSKVDQEEIHFPAGSSWIVFTDQVSHAAMAGQHVLEQTFSLPAEGLNEASTSPLKILEKFLNCSLT